MGCTGGLHRLLDLTSVIDSAMAPGRVPWYDAGQRWWQKKVLSTIRAIVRALSAQRWAPVRDGRKPRRVVMTRVQWMARGARV